MARKEQPKDLLTRLSDVGEEALSRVAGSPATARLLDSVGGMRERGQAGEARRRALEAEAHGGCHTQPCFDDEARGDAPHDPQEAV